jgi:hypothetical protein
MLRLQSSDNFHGNTSPVKLKGGRDKQNKRKPAAILTHVMCMKIFTTQNKHKK